MTAALILPGLDGAGALRAAFAAALAPDLRPVMVSYPSDRPLGYQALQELVVRHLPPGPFVLVGESFSSPLACRIAATRPEGLRALFLCAGFARSPMPWLSPLASLAALAPLHALPASAIGWSLFGPWATSNHVTGLRSALRKIPLKVLRYRAQEALRVDVSEVLGAINVPAFGLTASHDRVVGRGSSTHFSAHLPGFVELPVDGPHALLQAVPRVCAARIVAACRANGIVGRP